MFAGTVTILRGSKLSPLDPLHAGILDMIAAAKAYLNGSLALKVRDNKACVANFWQCLLDVLWYGIQCAEDHKLHTSLHRDMTSSVTSNLMPAPELCHTGKAAEHLKGVLQMRIAVHIGCPRDDEALFERRDWQHSCNIHCTT